MPRHASETDGGLVGAGGGDGGLCNLDKYALLSTLAASEPNPKVQVLPSETAIVPIPESPFASRVAVMTAVLPSVHVAGIVMVGDKS
ncbi:MAG: hypothetical protein ACRD4Q_11245 [Candidatus Acidiferrales bacterium]